MKIISVKFNGIPLTVHEVRVSAHPINRVWPGYQRDPSQAEPAWFVEFDMAESGILEVEYDQKLPSDLEVRPFSCNLHLEAINDRTIRLPIESPVHFALAQKNGHDALHVFADVPFHYERQPGDLYFGPGEHEVGVIMPKPGQTVCIDSGSIVYGMIFCYKADNVKVVGHGILDSSRLKCPKEAVAGEPGGELIAACQTLGFGFPELYVGGQVVVWGSRNFEMHGVTMVDSPSWAVCVRNGCDNVLFDDVKIVGQWRYNSDGIDICASTRSVIRNCFIRTFDDCIVARAPYLPGETSDMAVDDLLVEKCVLWCDWGKNLEVWCGEIPCRIRNVRFQDIDVIRVSHFVISITTTYGSADTLVENVCYRNIRVDTDDFYPESIYQRSDDVTYPDTPKESVPSAVYLYRGRMGHSLGNQAIQEADDLSGYHLIYRNIIIENLRFSNRKLPYRLAPDSILTLENITFLHCD
ncbi:MAG: hypothetical protein IJS15_11975 [Victivallales bacterium]|nr:hypothetical protein [Victivallales bacterium]